MSCCSARRGRPRRRPKRRLGSAPQATDAYPNAREIRSTRAARSPTRSTVHDLAAWLLLVPMASVLSAHPYKDSDTPAWPSNAASESRAGRRFDAK